MARCLLAAIIAMLVSDSATAEPPPPAVVGATRTLTKGATGCPELEGLLAVAMVLKERLKEGDIDAANRLFHQSNCVRIKPGTSVTVIELSPFGECLRPDYWPLGGPACLWTLKGSFGD